MSARKKRISRTESFSKNAFWNPFDSSFEKNFDYEVVMANKEFQSDVSEHSLDTNVLVERLGGTVEKMEKLDWDSSKTLYDDLQEFNPEAAPEVPFDASMPVILPLNNPNDANMSMVDQDVGYEEDDSGITFYQSFLAKYPPPLKAMPMLATVPVIEPTLEIEPIEPNDQQPQLPLKTRRKKHTLDTLSMQFSKLLNERQKVLENHSLVEYNRLKLQQEIKAIDSVLERYMKRKEELLSQDLEIQQELSGLDQSLMELQDKLDQLNLGVVQAPLFDLNQEGISGALIKEKVVGSRLSKSPLSCIDVQGSTVGVSRDRLMWIYDHNLEYKTTLEGHVGKIKCLSAFDGFVVSGGGDSLVKLWDVDSKDNLTKTYSGHTGGITSLCVMNDKLYSSSVDNSIKYWDLETGTCLLDITSDSFEAEPVFESWDQLAKPKYTYPRSLCSSTNFLVIGYCDGIIRVYDERQGGFVQLFQSHVGLRKVVLGDHLISLGQGVKIWDQRMATVLETIEIDEKIYDVGAEGSVVCLATQSGVWKYQDGLEKLTEERVKCLKFLNGMVYGGGDNFVKIWKA